MDIDSNMQKKIEELQIFERNMQNFLAQKQTIQIEFNETLNAVSEVKKAKDEVYRIVGGIMLRTEKEGLLKELEEKKKILELRISSIEKQERILEENAEKLRQEITKSLSLKKEK